MRYYQNHIPKPDHSNARHSSKELEKDFVGKNEDMDISNEGKSTDGSGEDMQEDGNDTEEEIEKSKVKTSQDVLQPPPNYSQPVEVNVFVILA